MQYCFIWLVRIEQQSRSIPVHIDRFNVSSWGFNANFLEKNSHCRLSILWLTYSNIKEFNAKVSRLIFLSERQALIKLNKQSVEMVARVRSRNCSFVYQVFRFGEEMEFPWTYGSKRSNFNFRRSEETNGRLVHFENDSST